MPHQIDKAAHVDCTVAHSAADAGFFGGLGLGIIVGIGIVVGTILTGGMLLPALGLAAGVAVTGSKIGESLGSIPDFEDSGHIARGSPTTFYGPQNKPAARMNDRTACFSPGMNGAERFTRFIPIFGDLSRQREMGRLLTVVAMQQNGEMILPSDLEPGAHPGSKIADGSMTVSIDMWPAARRLDGVFPCDGKISSGIDSIRIGGPRGMMVGTEVRDEVDATMRRTAAVIDFLGNLTGGWVKSGLYLAQRLAEWAGYEELALAISIGRTAHGSIDTIGRTATRWGEVEEGVSRIERIKRANDMFKALDNPRRRAGEYGALTQPPPTDQVFDPRRGGWVPRPSPG